MLWNAIRNKGSGEEERGQDVAEYPEAQKLPLAGTAAIRIPTH